MTTEQVLVVEKKVFPFFDNFGLIRDARLLEEILSKAKFIDRDKAENDPAYKQIISYAILRFKDLVFRYRRSMGVHETRLQGLYSLGVGGHINPVDSSEKKNSLITIVEDARDRELNEEFEVSYVEKPVCIGLLNDDSNDVGRVHVGVIYEYKLESPNVISKEKNNVESYGFVPVDRMIADINEYENWSRLIIKQYLNIAFKHRTKEK